MPIALKDITGLMIEKKQLDGIGEYVTGREVGRNELIDEQGQKKITLNREKLARIIWKYEIGCDGFDTWKTGQSQEDRDYCYRNAEFIIANEQNLIEVSE